MKLRILPAFLLSATALLLSGCIAGVTYTPGGPAYIFLDGVPIVTPGVISGITPHSSGPRSTTVEGFPLDSTGTPSPAITLTDSTGTFTSVALDGSGNIYVLSLPTGGQSFQIDVFNPNSSTPSTPVRVITLPSNIDGNPAALTVDPSGNSYVAFNDGAGTLLKYSPTAADSGSTHATPALTLTGIVASEFMCTDSHGNLYDAQFVETQNDEFEIINVYNAGFTTSTPARTINPTEETFFSGITVDGDGIIYTTAAANPDFDPEIAIFSTTTNTDPTTVITGPATTLEDPTGIAIDSLGAIYVRDNEDGGPIVITGPGGHSIQPHIPPDHPIVVDVFAPFAIGDIAPASSFTTPIGGNGRGLAIH